MLLHQLGFQFEHLVLVMPVVVSVVASECDGPVFYPRIGDGSLMCGVCVLSLYMRGFHPGALVSSHGTKVCMLG